MQQKSLEMGIVEATLIHTVAALYLAIVTGRIGTNQLVPNAQLCSGLLKERDQFTFGLSKAVGKLKSVISLDTFDGKSVPFEESISNSVWSAVEWRRSLRLTLVR